MFINFEILLCPAILIRQTQDTRVASFYSPFPFATMKPSQSSILLLAFLLFCEQSAAYVVSSKESSSPSVTSSPTTKPAYRYGSPDSRGKSDTTKIGTL